MQTRYYYADANNQPVGPFDLNDLQKMVSGGIINSITQVCAEGAQTWMPLNQVIPSHPQFPAVPVRAVEENEGISERELSQIWLQFWLSALGALIIHIAIIALMADLPHVPPMLKILLPAVPPFLLWAGMAKRIEKYKRHTGISYPATYFIIPFFCAIWGLGPLIILISFFIRVRKIPK